MPKTITNATATTATGIPPLVTAYFNVASICRNCFCNYSCSFLSLRIGYSIVLPFELNQGEKVTVAGPVPGTLYQAINAGETPATATVYYLTANGQPGNVTKPFVFTIS
jgi:hypothetical protein